MNARIIAAEVILIDRPEVRIVSPILCSTDGIGIASARPDNIMNMLLRPMPEKNNLGDNESNFILNKKNSCELFHPPVPVYSWDFKSNVCLD